MGWNVEVTGEFEQWFNTLRDEEKGAVIRAQLLLADRGPTLPYPHSSGIHGSKFEHMRELRIQHKGDPYRVLYAFDPRRTAILLLGGKKTGDDRWYDKIVPEADKLYQEHLTELQGRGLI